MFYWLMNSCSYSLYSNCYLNKFSIEILGWGYLSSCQRFDLWWSWSYHFCLDSCSFAGFNLVYSELKCQVLWLFNPFCQIFGSVCSIYQPTILAKIIIWTLVDRRSFQKCSSPLNRTSYDPTSFFLAYR